MNVPALSPGSGILRFFKRQSLIFLFFLVLLAIFLLRGSSFAYDKSVTFLGDGGKRLCSFKVQLAVTPEQQEKGLMYRKSLNKGTGMLFVFDTDQMRFFWMKNTYIPLDLVFVTSKFEVVNIFHYAKPLDESTMSSALPVKYVLEINAGDADRCGIRVGSKVLIRNISP
jgi:uncharacterized membrane protein (UPF0127 family)